MKFLKIENNPEKAVLFQNMGVDRIFLDLEILGKKERQKGLDTIISESHSINDVKKLSSVLTSSELLVRINPLNINSESEIEKCIKDGADVLMLPMFKTKKEVQSFINIINKRVKTCLLLETSQALCRIDDILSVDGIDEIHIGLNDLHLSMGLDFMFELLSGGIVEYIIKKIKPFDIKFGFGGIAPLDKGLISGEMILKEHVRLNSSSVILSRPFDALLDNDFQSFEDSFIKLKNKHSFLINNRSKIDFKNNMITIKKNIVNILKNKL